MLILKGALYNISGKVRLRTMLVVPFFLQIVAAVGLVGYLSFRNGQRAIDDLATQLNKEIGVRINQHVSDYLDKSYNVLVLIEAGVQSRNLQLDNFPGLRRYFWQVVQKEKLESYIYFGNDRGEFVGVERMEDGSAELRLRTTATAPIREIYLLDEFGGKQKLLKSAEYDPRTRPWYEAAKLAGKATWSPIFSSFSRENTSLVVSPVRPIYDSNNKLLGVLSINLSLRQITDFLKSLNISPNGQSFIIERSGELIASSTISQPFIIKGEGKDREIDRIPADNSQNEIVSSTTRYLTEHFGDFAAIDGSQNLKFKIENSWHYVEVMPIRDGRGIDWLAVVVIPESDFMAQIYANTRHTLLLCSLALLLAIIVGILTARWITRPMLKVSIASEEIAAGKLEQHIEPSNIIEIEKLTNSFNSMAKQLQDYFAALEKQNEDLKHLDQLKNEFLANTSHELRTPLNGIIGIAESLIDGATGELPQTTQANLNLIVSSGRRLSNLINDILDFSKLRHKNIELQLKPVDLRSITNVILTLSQPLVAHKNLKLINSIPADFPPAEADENRLQQILHNLVGNAIKFTPAGTVEVLAELVPFEKVLASADRSQIPNAKCKIQITVSDSGIGIPEEKFDRIFESFEQAEGSTARDYGGTGLGLAVTKKLVQLHGGELSVKSKVGEGSQFTFTLPISSIGKVEISRPVIAIKDNQNIELTTSILSQHLEATINTQKQFKVLIVDDEPINRQVLINNLSLYNYAITEASNGQEALAVMEDGFIPDLILLDVMMPRMTGYEVAQKIRDRFPAYELPIVMLTAKNQVTDIVEGFESGANDYLSKPIQKKEMLARIKTHISLAKLTSAYGRFVPRNFLKFLEKESIIDVRLGDQVQQQMTVMFSDIRSFTTLSEAMTPQETFNFINSYLSRVSPAIRQHNGFIDKYIGDAIMALFPESANDAVQAAIAMQKEVETYNQDRQKMGYPPIAIGIGLHTGNLMLGTIGESERMETTVIADAVNLASRLEGLTKLYGAGILISHKTLCCLDYYQEQHFRFLDRVTVKGKKSAVAVFEVYEGDEPEQKRLKSQTQARFEVAVFLYYQKQFEEAQQIFQEVLQVNPQDKAASVYIKRCEHHRLYGVPEGWDGVEAIDEK
ncbi:ATP-binding protein [Aerosakkonema funiforme]|uniref:ATP-binding protein n=1 Tax=Aerosakkonema funiforme TaxID=1246630 RepID=UPI0035B90834